MAFQGDDLKGLLHYASGRIRNSASGSDCCLQRRLYLVPGRPREHIERLRNPDALVQIGRGGGRDHERHVGKRRTTARFAESLPLRGEWKPHLIHDSSRTVVADGAFEIVEGHQDAIAA